MIKIKTIQSASIITKSKLPDVDYVVNPYVGCSFGCLYCYASFMGRTVGENQKAWGNYVYIKENAVDLFKRELIPLAKKSLPPSILLSSVTDPYQGVEKKHKLVRQLLEYTVEVNYPGLISILTKSPLVTRDIDLFTKLPNIEVGMTITTTEDSISDMLEVNAPRSSERIQSLKTLHDSNIPTYAFIGPLLPHYKNEINKLEDLFATLSEAGVSSIFIEQINLSSYIKDILINSNSLPKDTISLYKNAKNKENMLYLNNKALEFATKYNLSLRQNKVLDHVEDKVIQKK